MYVQANTQIQRSYSIFTNLTKLDIIPIAKIPGDIRPDKDQPEQ